VWEGKDSGHHARILPGNQGKTSAPQFCFQRGLFQLELSLSYTMQGGWAGDVHDGKNQLLCDTVGCFLMFLNEKENETGP